MQETLQEFIASIQQPLTRILGESIVNVLYAILILIALLIAYKVSKCTAIGKLLSMGLKLYHSLGLEGGPNFRWQYSGKTRR